MESSSPGQDCGIGTEYSDTGGSDGETDTAATDDISEGASTENEYQQLVRELGADSARGTYQFYRLERYLWPD
jgi:hypothetical protein